MKYLTFLLLYTCCVSNLYSQNVQLHYDFGKDRNYLTSTVEMFKTDKWGSTFFFVDMDYNVGEVKGISMAYWEIARELNLGKSPIAFHAEYNGGFGQYFTPDYFGAYQINDSWLAGSAFNYNNKEFTRGFSIQLLYKYIRDKHNASFQITGVWYMNMLNNKLTFSGFADFWKEDNDFINNEGAETTEFVFQSEPQLWYNFTENISIGTELELGYNFVPVKGFRLNPTIGAKWTF
ncbi:MAG: hypothetical protein FD166_3142 [Bacteroidetes bacterium]|nr:MAG: hypothetical protein FD166_3142 [Bacteroidota bacterium]